MSPTSIVEKMHQIKKQSILFLNVNYSPRNAPFPRSAIFAELVSTNLIPAILYQEGKGMSIQMRCKGEKAAASNDAHFAFELRGEKGRLLMWELSVQRRKNKKGEASYTFTCYIQQHELNFIPRQKAKDKRFLSAIADDWLIKWAFGRGACCMPRPRGSSSKTHAKGDGEARVDRMTSKVKKHESS